MAKLFDKLFKKNVAEPVAPVAPKTDRPAFAPLPRPKYDFVEQYTIIDPKRVLNGGYELWLLCEKVPVVCEESKISPCGFRASIELPTKVILGFLGDLKNAPAEKIADPKKRLLSIVHLNEKNRVYIFPNLKEPKNPWFVVENSDDESAKGWSLYTTPEKSRAIVEQLKMYTR